MVFGKLFDKAKNLWGNVKNTVSNWMSGKFLAPGGYNYCGPGNPLENGAPKNATDSACQVHDMEYSAIARNTKKMSQEDINRMVRDSDHKLISSIDQSGNDDIGSRMSKFFINGKMKLEDLGIMNPTQFVTE